MEDRPAHAWSAADLLRANSGLASNEYFLPVMGPIILRHAYSRYLAVKSEIETHLPSRGGKVHALTQEEDGAAVEAWIPAHTFSVLSGCSWVP